MKKLLIIAVMVLGTIAASGQNKVQKDTVVVKTAVKFDKETFEGSKGSFKETYQVFMDGKWYSTTKTSYERYFTIKRYGGTPTVVAVKSGKTTKIAVL